MLTKNSLPIGVFDSGVGGLTVLKTLVEALPNESFIYLGDTARLPYGTKSPQTVVNYSIQICEALIHQGVKMLVVACNTASALALNTLRERFPEIPIVGVIEPSAYACAHMTKTNAVIVLATEATIKGQAYQNMIHHYNPQVQVIGKSCNLWVALVEEGWTEGKLVEEILASYLNPLINDPANPDSIMLGCTHFPALAKTIRNIVGEKINIIDSASVTATAVKRLLDECKSHNRDNQEIFHKFLVTDSPERFADIGGRFMQRKLDVADVDLIIS